jgi:hypothetical protein
VKLAATKRPGAVSLDDVHTTFRDWFGAEYDLAAIDAVMAAVAAERLGGDPLWLLVVAGSGAAKTETVSAAGGAGALITSTITSEGALLSASPKRERSKDATGGLLQRLGPSGVLVIKDVTSILSMDRNSRAGVLAAFREVHDGRWERNVGTDGGKTLTWAGRIVVIGACTTAWDRAHDVIASMGDRFVTIRMNSAEGRLSACYKAMANTGAEATMRGALSTVVGGLLGQVSHATEVHLSPSDREAIAAASDIVCRARTGVEFDYRGDVVDAHDLEMPTRFAKQLVQLMRGGVALGMDRAEALGLALRCARDSMPPLRLAILEDVAANPHTRTRDIRQRLAKPYNTVDRQLKALHMLGVLDCDEMQTTEGGRSVWYYSVNPSIDVAAIRLVPDLLVGREGREEVVHVATHISGTEGIGNEW